MNEKWKHVRKLMHEINTNNFEVFNDNVVYHYFRRFRKELPFQFERYIEDLKKSKKVKIIKRSDVLNEIFLSFPIDIKENILNYYLYKFHQHKVSKKKIFELERYLDTYRDELFNED